jgi:hypothetical protein
VLSLASLGSWPPPPTPLREKEKGKKIKIPARMRSSSDSCLRMKKKRFSLVVEAVCYLGLAIRLDHPFFV